jgi:RHS repeat-associated protein
VERLKKYIEDGHSSLLTSNYVNASQFEYACWQQAASHSETFVDQQNGYDSRYTFSAKEKDDETQYSYFGARYYDSDLSVWLSVDPMADSRSWISPYNYCQWNPIGRVDPTGALDWHPDGLGNLVADEGDDWYSLGRYIYRTTNVKLSFGTLTRLIGSMYKGNPIRNIKGHFLYFRDIKKIAGSEVSNGLNPGIQSVYEGHRRFGGFLFGWIKDFDDFISGRNSGTVKTNDPYPDSHPEDDEYNPFFIGNTNPNTSGFEYDDGGSDDYSGYGGPMIGPKSEDRKSSDSFDIRQDDGSYYRYGPPKEIDGKLKPQYRNVSPDEHQKNPYPNPMNPNQN